MLSSKPVLLSERDIAGRSRTDLWRTHHVIREAMAGLPTTPVSPLAVSWAPATDRGRHRALLRALFVE